MAMQDYERELRKADLQRPSFNQGRAGLIGLGLAVAALALAGWLIYPVPYSDNSNATPPGVTTQAAPSTETTTGP